MAKHPLLIPQNSNILQRCAKADPSAYFGKPTPGFRKQLFTIIFEAGFAERFSSIAEWVAQSPLKSMLSPYSPRVAVPFVPTRLVHNDAGGDYVLLQDVFIDLNHPTLRTYQ